VAASIDSRGGRRDDMRAAAGGVPAPGSVRGAGRVESGESATGNGGSTGAAEFIGGW
jgi:hypothetical protein